MGQFAQRPVSKNIENDLNTLNGKIGNTALPTTAQTLTGAIAEHETDISSLNSNLTINKLYGANEAFYSSVESNIVINGGYTNIEKQGNRIHLRCLLNVQAQKNAWTKLLDLKSNMKPKATSYFVGSGSAGSRIFYANATVNSIDSGVDNIPVGLYLIDTEYEADS